MNPGALFTLIASLSAAHAGPVFVGADVARKMLADGALVLDARGKKTWEAGHPPGSAPIDWKDHRQSWVRDGRLDADTEGLGRALAALGVRDDRPVLVVGAGREGWGEEGRIYWMLDHLGHPDVRIMDGGWPAWTASGLPTVTDRSRPAAGAFTPRPRPATQATLAEVTAGLEQGVVFWDTREAREYAGETPYMEPRGGHLPGAKHLWFKELMTETGTLKNRGELRALLMARGIPLDQPVIAYCTGGVRSGFAYGVLKELGATAPANYDGSMWEWTADADRPLTPH